MRIKTSIICVVEGGDTTGVTEDSSDTDEASVNTLDGTHWTCEDCDCENPMDDTMMECLHCHKTRPGKL